MRLHRYRVVVRDVNGTSLCNLTPSPYVTRQSAVKAAKALNEAALASPMYLFVRQLTRDLDIRDPRPPWTAHVERKVDG